MNENIKYGLIGWIASVSGLQLLGLGINISIAFLIGFAGAVGGIIAKLLYNYLRNKF